jgi:membrane-bound lytic murein transglycosylase D
VVVRAGRNASVSAIAARYKVSAANVAQWNRVSTSASFKSTQSVILYLPQRQATQASKSAAPSKGSAKKGGKSSKPTQKQAATPAKKKPKKP